MKKMIVFSAVMLAVISATVTAGIEWQRSDPGTTWQEWHFSTGANPAAPEVTNNPGALAQIEVIGVTHGVEPGWKPDWWGRSGVWIGEETKITLTIPNFPPPNPYKEIWIEMVFWGEIMPNSGIIDPPQGVTLLSETSAYTPDNWRIWNAHWRIEPNPIAETLSIHIANSGAIVDYIIVDTICVPEPATPVLLGLGGLLLKRKKS